MVSVETFQDQFGRLKAVEGEKNQLIENLIARVGELEVGGTGKKPQVERDQGSSRVSEPTLSDAHSELRRINEEIDSNSFVSVLIDGDSMLFLDALVRSAQQGGESAARHLRTSVREYILERLDIPYQVPLRIRVYANMKTLASTYYNNDILDSIDDFAFFIRGFNGGDPMCDFVDAGDGEEGTASKLRAWFKHDMADVQCRAVLFGASGNPAFSSLIQPHVAESLQHSRVTLIQGPPFAKELEALKDNFPVARFPDVFRATQLASTQGTHSLALTVDPPSYASSVGSSASAGMSRTDDALQVSIPSPAPGLVATSGSGSGSILVLLNSYGQRIDSIIKPLPNLVKSMKNKNYCSAYHIYGGCLFNKCSFVHGRRLERHGIEAQRYIARLEPCPLGTTCRDEKCLCGHACPDPGCVQPQSRWVGPVCPFPPEMHDVDRV